VGSEKEEIRKDATTGSVVNCGELFTSRKKEEDDLN